MENARALSISKNPVKARKRIVTSLSKAVERVRTLKYPLSLMKDNLKNPTSSCEYYLRERTQVGRTPMNPTMAVSPLQNGHLQKLRNTSFLIQSQSPLLNDQISRQQQYKNSKKNKNISEIPPVKKQPSREIISNSPEIKMNPTESFESSSESISFDTKSKIKTRKLNRPKSKTNVLSLPNINALYHALQNNIDKELK